MWPVCCSTQKNHKLWLWWPNVRNSGMKWVTVISLNYFQWLSSFFCRFGSFWEVWGLEEWSRRHEQLRKEANLCLPCFTVSDSACIAYYIIIYILWLLSCWFLVESVLRLYVNWVNPTSSVHICQHAQGSQALWHFETVPSLLALQQPLFLAAWQAFLRMQTLLQSRRQPPQGAQV